ncbi:MAG TPA: hypothetical protein H9860_01335 [Candidatus Gemmiger faecavium]|nr:hypothetical protein [Candidatus Gemmiger faecavium]
MTTVEKIDAYLTRAKRYFDTPWYHRDPAEREALMAMKAEIYAEIERMRHSEDQ